MDESNAFLGVLRHYWEKKVSELKTEPSPFARDAIQRLRSEVRTNREVPALVDFPEPVEPTHESKLLRMPSIERMKDRSKLNVSLLSSSDFEEYGKVFKYLKEHPQADDKEIARYTGLHVSRAEQLHQLIENAHKKGT